MPLNDCEFRAGIDIMPHYSDGYDRLIRQEGGADEEKLQSAVMMMLVHALESYPTVCVAGSGLSRQIFDKEGEQKPHYPEWSELIDWAKGEEAGRPGGNVTTSADELAVRMALYFGESERREALAKRFKDSAEKTRLLRDGVGPALVKDKLGVGRFLTLNYDLEIELAFGMEIGKLDHGPGKSLKADPYHPEELAFFATAAPGYEQAVFHMHGRCDDWESMVLTEEDYQKKYANPADGARQYQDYLDLVFASNAIVFCGAGLTEVDVLRPLRTQMVVQPGIPERPIFALIQQPNDKNVALSRRQSLYMKYGIKVLYYGTTASCLERFFCNQHVRHNKEFAEVLDGISNCRDIWIQERDKRVPIRPVPKAKAEGDQKFERHGIYADPDQHQEDEQPDPVGETDLAKEILGQLAVPPRGKLMLVLGSPGSGKGALGANIVRIANPECPQNSKKYARVFFATTHFSNEFLASLEAAARFFGQPPKPGVSLSQRLRDALSGPERFLLVLGAVERLLIEESLSDRGAPTSRMLPGSTKFALTGRPATQEVAEIIAALLAGAKEGCSDVVLTSVLWPTVLPANTETEFKVRVIPASSKDEYSTYLLRGNQYAQKLTAANKGNASETELLRRSYSERLPWLIQEAIKELTAVEKEILELVALVTTPVTPHEINIMFEAQPLVKNREPQEELKKGVGEILQDLAEANLLERIQKADYHTARYTAHSAVRAVLYPPGQTQRFILPGFAEQGDDLQHVTKKAHTRACRAYDALLEPWQKDYAPPQTPPCADPLPKEKAILRAAFGIARGRWPAINMGRIDHIHAADLKDGEAQHGHFDQYLQRLARLSGALRSSADMGSLWRYMPGIDLQTVEKDDGVLYADELGWLANEIALTSFMQGRLGTAYHWYRAADQIYQYSESGLRGRRWCLTELNLGVLLLEAGKLARGHHHLRRCREAALWQKESELAHRALGFMGMHAHLSHDLKTAIANYDAALEDMYTNANYRGISIFQRLKGDALRFRDAEDAAIMSCFQEAEAAALRGQHPDLLHFARVASANFRIDRSKQNPALGRAVEFASRMGIPKLAADALTVQAREARHMGDIDRAARLNIRALGIACINDLGLRVTRNLVEMARISVARDAKAAALSILEIVREKAMAQGYFLQANEAQKLSLEL